MVKIDENQSSGQGLEFWENEVLVLQNALEGMRTSYAVISQMLHTAQLKVTELTPTREEVLNG